MASTHPRATEWPADCYGWAAHRNEIRVDLHVCHPGAPPRAMGMQAAAATAVTPPPFRAAAPALPAAASWHRAESRAAPTGPGPPHPATTTVHQRLHQGNTNVTKCLPSLFTNGAQSYGKRSRALGWVQRNVEGLGWHGNAHDKHWMPFERLLGWARACGTRGQGDCGLRDEPCP